MPGCRTTPPGPARRGPRPVSWLALPLLAAFLLACAPGPSPRTLPQLWFYYDTNFADEDSHPRLERIWRRAAAAGYTHVMLVDVKFARLGRMNPRYFQNLNRARRLADELGLQIVPTLFSVGRSNSMLALAPDLAEGFLVEKAPFVVRGGVAVPVTDPAVVVPDRPRWVDPGVHVEGRRATIRNNLWRARWIYDLRVQPHRCYRVSVWVRTENYRGRPQIQVLDRGKRPLCLTDGLGVRRTQDWTRHQVVFNSLENREIGLYFGAWRRARGLVEFRDWTIEECGPVNLLRRPGTPFVVRDSAGVRLVEGRDYAAIRDTLTGNSPWAGQYDAWHEPPALVTRLPEGSRLRASWSHAAVTYDGEVTCCLSDPVTYALFEDEARRVRATFRAPAYMMQFDEARAMNQDGPCRRRGLGAGALLAEAARRCTGLLAGSRAYVWSDMFDPYHNAVRDYALVRGDLTGSWEGLDPAVTIVNWNGERARESLRFFAARGHRQILAGYYDGRPGEVSGWLSAARGIRGVEGVMYTTWRHDYDDLEAFARACGVEPLADRAK